MKRLLRVPLIVSAIVPFLFTVAGAQSDAPKGDNKAADKAEAKPAKKRAKPRGRLPAYYSQVVNGEQRAKIYAIQQQYDSKISALKAELAAMQDKLDAECEGVLTPEQREKVKTLSEAAKQKRKGGASARAAASAKADGGDAAKAAPAGKPDK